jgi:hypothetical protein
MKILVSTASYGDDKCYLKNLFKSHKYICDFIKFDSNNFPFHHVKDNRLKSKYPKMVPFKYHPGYDWYFWFDSKFILKNNFDLDLFIEHLKISDNRLVICKHPQRNSVAEEVHFMDTEIKKNNRYLVKRYDIGTIKEQANTYFADKKFIDNKLFSMGFFGFHKSAAKLMTEWLSHNEKFSLQDQVSFPYILVKSKLKYKVLDLNILKNNYFEHVSSLKRQPIGFLKFIFLKFFQ